MDIFKIISCVTLCEKKNFQFEFDFQAKTPELPLRFSDIKLMLFFPATDIQKV